jgi:quercetin dioxygenase-like cupin family protein
MSPLVLIAAIAVAVAVALGALALVRSRMAGEQLVTDSGRVQGAAGENVRHGPKTQAQGSPPPTCEHPRMAERPVVVPPGEGHRVGNVEFLARTADTPRFTLGIIDFAAGRELEEHVHVEEDDAFYVLDGELTITSEGEEISAPPGTFVLAPSGVPHGLRNDGAGPVRILNIHAPGGFDRRIGLVDESD